MAGEHLLREPRVRVSFPVDRDRAAFLQPGTILDASTRGFLAQFLGEVPHIGELMRLVVHLPEGTIVLHAVPSRAVSTSNGTFVACRTFALNGHERERWEHAVGAERDRAARAA